MQTLHSTNRLGGAITTDLIVDNTLNNLFDDPAGEEHFVGDTEYRCFFVKNESGLVRHRCKVWINTNTAAADDSIFIGLDPASGSPVQAIATEQIAPTGVSFTQPGIYDFLLIGDLAPGASRAVWVKRVVVAGYTEYTETNFVLKFSSDS